MKQLTERQVIYITFKQKTTLDKLRKLNVNVNQFIRDAIREKLERDFPKIKERKSKVKIPF